MTRSDSESATEAVKVRAPVLAAIASGTLLNPLNSSMIAVALVAIARHFTVSIPTVTWLVSGFYLAAAVGQPLMGRLADRFGPRRIFLIGVVLVFAAGVLGPLAPSLGALIGVRVLQAFGTSTAYPSGLAVIRRLTGNPRRPPAAALGVLSIAANVSAALGPTLGGGIIAFADWQGIFAVNLVLAVIAFALALRYLPPDPQRGERKELDGNASRGRIDLLGILLFAGTLSSLLFFLLSLSKNPRWPFLPLAAVLAVLFVLRERRCKDPFVDIDMVASGRGLGRVYLTFAAMNTVFYSLFFGLPLWLEQGHGFKPDLAGLLMLPFAGLAVLATPVAARLIRVHGVRMVIIIGMSTMAGGSLMLLLLGAGSSVAAIVGVTLVLGVPNGFNNLGLQTALFQAAPPEKIGAASGLLQTSRYAGTFLSSALLGIIFGSSAGTWGLHVLAVVLGALSVALLCLSLGGRPRSGVTARD